MVDTMRVGYHIKAFDRDGELVQEEFIEKTASLTIEEISLNAIINGVDSIEVSVIDVEIEKDDGTIMEWTVDSE